MKVSICILCSFMCETTLSQAGIYSRVTTQLMKARSPNYIVLFTATSRDLNFVSWHLYCNRTMTVILNYKAYDLNIYWWPWTFWHTFFPTYLLNLSSMVHSCPVNLKWEMWGLTGGSVSCGTRKAQFFWTGYASQIGLLWWHGYSRCITQWQTHTNGKLTFTSPF